MEQQGLECFCMRLNGYEKRKATGKSNGAGDSKLGLTTNGSAPQ
jgi:hypothetical protein